MMRNYSGALDKKSLKNSRRNILIIFLTLLLITGSAFLYTACGIADGLGFGGKKPTIDNTYTNIEELNKLLYESTKKGMSSVTFNIAVIGEEDLKYSADQMDTFYGKPKTYVVNHEYKKVDGIVDGKEVTVKNITTTLELSDNYYVVDYILNGTPIPANKETAIETAKCLEEIANEVELESGESDYSKALAIHDWLVNNIEYDTEIEDISRGNSSYGALVERKTMCQGYAEAMALYLTCYTDITNQLVTGKARSTPDAEWGGHAWNIAKLDGGWYHIDATFDDPKGGSSNSVTHFYFGQSDQVMAQDHSWLEGAFANCESGDFLYYRTENMFASDWPEFQEIMRSAVNNFYPKKIEIACIEITPDQNSMQFMFAANRSLKNINYGINTYENISVFTFELNYY